MGGCCQGWQVVTLTASSSPDLFRLSSSGKSPVRKHWGKDAKEGTERLPGLATHPRQWMTKDLSVYLLTYSIRLSMAGPASRSPQLAQQLAKALDQDCCSSNICESRNQWLGTSPTHSTQPRKSLQASSGSSNILRQLLGAFDFKDEIAVYFY